MSTTLHDLALARQTVNADPVAKAFALLSGREVAGAVSWLRRGYNDQVALAIRAHNQAQAFSRREKYAASILAELHQLPERTLNDDLLLEHLAADQNDDHWRVAFVNYRTTDTRRQWCRAASRFHALNLTLMRALKQEGM